MRFFVFVKKVNGFTLLELLIVLSILAFIITIAVPGYRHVSNSSVSKACRSSCELAEDAWGMSMAQDPEMNDEVRMGKLIRDIGDLCPADGVVIRIENMFICMLYDERADYIEESVLKETCEQSRKQLYEEYQAYLQEHGLVHGDIIFQQFLDRMDKHICSSGGELSCDGMKIDCSIHAEEEVTPFL